ncbi:MAG TPA: NAD(P)H-dependent glycerol-3-phosphate dehydrogenase [Terriglobia bacterium]|nr:NAD(P)H-dependent glycerol-3-phosphate dehydrogenase [Terriglobia bacterium]
MTGAIAVVGAGSWGTALAATWARSEKTVRLWCRRSELAESMRRTRQNPDYLPGVSIPPSVEIDESIEQIVSGASIVVLAAPSHVYRSVLAELAPSVRPETIFVSAAKGIENDTLMRMSEVTRDVFRSAFTPRFAALSGPTFAPEVARGEPAAVVIASNDARLRARLQQELSTPRFRLYTNADTVGVEMGAAAKNIIAIAAGVTEGLGLGSNTTAALITRGLAEITRLAVACGGRRETLAGLAGLGDLALTSYGYLSRNRQVGIALGQGRSIAEITAGMRMVAEGVKTTKSAVALAGALNVDMPIAAKMYAVLYEGLRPEDAIDELMERKLREE